ncbi:hypothetical protein C2S52_008246 [Perilla frutescens var. hirtella]|nr:hypothetical protein C2S52_008246 [Perilla frutescens var. hirtella]
MSSPADPNELLRLELSRAWEPIDSSSASTRNQTKEAQHYEEGASACSGMRTPIFAFYLPLTTISMHESIVPLEHLATCYDLAWVCMGDFNEILYLHEKEGGLPRDHLKMLAFHNAISACNLEDLGFNGYRFTWTNGQSGTDNIQERLDRCLANQKWIDLALPTTDEGNVLIDLKPSGFRKSHALQLPKWLEEKASIEYIFTGYFKEIFTSEPTVRVEKVLEAVQPRVTDEINESLGKPFTAKEVVEALKQMHPLKAPGPDVSFFDVSPQSPTPSLLMGILGSYYPSRDGWLPPWNESHQKGSYRHSSLFHG